MNRRAHPKARERWVWTLSAVLSLLFFIACGAFIVAYVWVSAERQLSSLENAFFQVSALVLGLVGAFLFGRRFSESEAWDRVQQQSRPARRNLERILGGLSGITSHIHEVRDDMQRQATRHEGMCPIDYVEQGLRGVEVLVNVQVAATANAIADWGDLTEDEAREITVASTMAVAGEKRELSVDEVNALREEGKDERDRREVSD